MNMLYLHLFLIPTCLISLEAIEPPGTLKFLLVPQMNILTPTLLTVFRIFNKWYGMYSDQSESALPKNQLVSHID